MPQSVLPELKRHFLHFASVRERLWLSSLSSVAQWESLAMNQRDGNKRVAFACMDIFLGLNGARLEAGPDDVIAFIYRHLEAGTFRKPVLEEWLRAHVIPTQL